MDTLFNIKDFSLSHTLSDIPASFVDVVVHKALTQPNDNAYTFLGDDEQGLGQSITYAQLDRRARAIAAQLRTVTPCGRRVLLLYPPGLDYIVAFIACLYAGVIAVPAPPPRGRRSLPRIEAIFRDAEPTAALSTARTRAHVAHLPIKSDEFRRVLWVETDAVSDEIPSEWRISEPNGETIAFLQYTSGSTGTPKGVMISHGNLIHSVQMLQQAFELTDKLNVVGWLPPYHDMGLVGNLLVPLYTGRPAVLMSPVSFLQKPYRWLHAISKYGGTVSGGPNFAYDLCVQKISTDQRAQLDLSHWRSAFNGAEPIRPETLERFAATFEPCGFHREAFYPCYGLAEATLFVAGGVVSNEPVVRTFDAKALERHQALPSTSAAGSPRRLVGCGEARSPQDIVIVDPQRLVPVPPEQVGEIWVRGPNVAQGYWNRPIESTETFGGHLMNTGEGPFLRTGDLGFLCGRELFITGRLKDLLIIRGRNLYPQDIERTVEGSHASLRANATAVVSAYADGEDRLVVIQELEFRQKADFEEVFHAIRRAVAEEHEVQVFAVLLIRAGTLPKTSSGKVERHICCAQFLAGGLKVLAESTLPTASVSLSNDIPSREALSTRLVPPHRSAVRDGVCEATARVLHMAPSNLDTSLPLTAFGLDSLTAAELQQALHHELGVLVPLTVIVDGTTLDGLVNAVMDVPDHGKRSTDIVANIVAIPAPDDWYRPYTLTDIQQAYWVGRRQEFELGNVAMHVYLEFQKTDLDIERLSRAWQMLVDRHPMLRTIVRPDGKQQVLKQTPPYEFCVVNLIDKQAVEAERHVHKVRERMSHQVLAPDHWPLFDIRILRLSRDEFRIHFSIDFLIVDASSLVILFREWGQLYADLSAKMPSLAISFRDYVTALQELESTDVYRRAEQYWRSQLSSLPPAPRLPMVKTARTSARPRFDRLSAELAPDVWQRLRERAGASGLTPSGLLLAAYAEVLGRWSGEPCFSINVARFDRFPLHPHVENLVGQFASFVLIAIDRSSPGSFVARARRIQKCLWEALDHRHFGGVRVIRELAAVRGRSTKALMPVVFTSVLKDMGGMDWLGQLVYSISQTPQVWLDHQVFEKNGALLLIWDVVKELFADSVPEDMFAAYHQLLRELAEDESTWHSACPIQLPDRDVASRVAINDTKAPVPSGTLATLFAEQAQRHPDHVAIVSSSLQLTYGELHNRASQLGNQLRERAAHPNSLVAVVMEKGWEQVVAVLGVAYSGAAYLPLDPELPPEPLDALLQRTRVRHLLTQSRLVKRLPSSADVELICVDVIEPDHRGPRSLGPQHPDHLAYVIFTSGSTGEPKGVMVRHRSVVNAIHATNERFGVGSTDRLLSITGLHHDMSVYDIFGILAAGGTIVMPDAGCRRDPAHWADLLIQERVTIWNSVPALMELLVERLVGQGVSLPSLRLAFLGGDWIPIRLPDRLRAIAESAQVVSVGGPTETTLWNIWYPVETVDENWESIPYGQPIANTRYYILDEHMEDCPLWVPGEMYCAGVGVAKGYWDDEDETNGRFVRHPRTAERLYKTGDRGRYMVDGNIEFLGRIDSQVNINGNRIEPRQIEAVLNEHPAVQASAVVAIGEQVGTKRLVAYIVAAAPTRATTELNEYLRRKLPPVMIPSRFEYLERLPVNANGKVDRRTLSDHAAAEAVSTSVRSVGRASVAQRVGQVVASVLQLEAVAADADFFNLGATSVDIIRISNELENEFGYRPRIEEVFRSPTVAALASCYEVPDRQGALLPSATQSASTASLAQELLDPAAREAFQDSRPGLRKDLADRHHIQLARTPLVENLKRQYLQRCSHRVYSTRPVSLEDFTAWLARLRPQWVNGKLRYLYGSAGGLYPVQAYLHIKEGGVQCVAPGTYYYDPLQHQLVLLYADVMLDADVHVAYNRPIFTACGFSVFLIAQLNAIAPLYGPLDRDFCFIEAGLMTQLLTAAAPEHGIGLCSIGDLQFKRVAGWFDLEDSHVLVHSFVGGALEQSSTTLEPCVADPAVVQVAEFVPGDQANVDAGPTVPPTPSRRPGPATCANVADLRSEAILDPGISRGPVERVVEQRASARILLTGATGYLGSYLLAHAQRSRDLTVYCLIRGSTAADCELKLKRRLRASDLSDAVDWSRIVVVPGDLSKPRFGLPRVEYEELSAELTAIYHSAAEVNWVCPYHVLKASNVEGMHQIIRFASNRRTKPVHYVSTLAVFPFNGKAVTEDASLDHHQNLYGGYAQSKWVAERLLTAARDRGFPVTVFRPAIISGHSISGLFNADAYLECLIKGCIQLKLWPDLATIVDIVPVDYVADAIVHLALNGDSLGRVFHLRNPRPVHQRWLFDFVRSLGYPAQCIPFKDWKRQLFASDHFTQNALALFGPFVAGLEERATIMAQHDHSNTRVALAGSSAVCPPAKDLLHVYFRYFQQTGFLAKPPSLGN